METVDNVVPGEKWEFDASVADCLSDEEVNSSI